VQQSSNQQIHDLFIIGGGVNGCGIARDAAGRGLDVALAEMNDLASATSSASTKLFHGGLRYLEYFELRLVRESLAEREALWTAMPHISWPMRFILPHHGSMRYEVETPVSRLLGLFMPWLKGRRPVWLIRTGLFLYDHIGARRLLPGTSRVDLKKSPEGTPLDDRFVNAFEYSDCWVEDSRLVVLNARDAEARGAEIMTRTRVTGARREGDTWVVETERTDDGTRATHRARMLINAAGPWVGEFLEDVVQAKPGARIRLVRGSHIITPRLYDHDKAYFLQGTDGRIAFVLPFEQDFSLIGTTELAHADASLQPVCTSEEQDYLINFVNAYFKRQISRDDIVWTYSGVRPLYDDGSTSATAATRDYVLSLDDEAGAPLLNVFGGKITTYRRVAEAAMKKVATHFPDLPGNWTRGVPLPGGDFDVQEKPELIGRLIKDYPFLTDTWAARLIRAYGRDAWQVLGAAAAREDLGPDFGATLSGAEVLWLMRREFAHTADDIVWRRSKLGLRLSAAQIERLNTWMATAQAGAEEVVPIEVANELR
jgi:glycerol-3-phosphate dehydrogenase